VQDCTFQKDQDPDQEWSLVATPSRSLVQPQDVYLAKKGAGVRLAQEYLEAAGVGFLDTWSGHYTKVASL
jgi:hypothetical protein